MKKIKIALLATSFLPSKGGAEIGLSNLANNLSRNGHKVYVVVPFSNFLKLNKYRKDLRYNLIFFPPRFWYCFFKYRFFFNLISYLYFYLLNLLIKPDVYHCTNGFPLGFTMIKLNKNNNNNKFKYLIRCTGEDIQRSEDVGYGVRLNNKYNSEIEKYFRFGTNFVAITKSIYNEYIKLNISKEKIHLIPNGVSLKSFYTKIDIDLERSKYNIQKDDFVFLCVSRNHPKKGLNILLQAYNRFQEKFETTKVKLLIYGTDVKKINISNKNFLQSPPLLIEGKKDKLQRSQLSNNYPSLEVINLYKLSDAFVFPSLIESFGIVLIEAMAAKLPIISTNTDGCRDVLEDGKYGIIVKKNNPDELMTAMSKLYNDSELRIHYTNIYKDILPEYDFENITEKYEELYKNIIR